MKDDYLTKGLSSLDVLERIKKGQVNVMEDETIKTPAMIIFSNVFNLFNALNLFLALLVVLSGHFRNMLFMGVVITNTEVDHSAYINGILARAFGAAAVVLTCVVFVVIVNLLKELRNERKKAEEAADKEMTVSAPYDDEEYREMLDAIRSKLDTLRAEREVSDERVMAEIRKIFDNQLETLRNEIRCNADFQKEAEKAIKDLDAILGGDNGEDRI